MSISGDLSLSLVFSPPAVREMTRNQIPGIGTVFEGIVHREASWGLGWTIQHDECWKSFNSTLAPKGMVYHTGGGGHMIWVDPVNQIVGVYLSVTLIETELLTDRIWPADLFVNMATAAVVE